MIHLVREFYNNQAQQNKAGLKTKYTWHEGATVSEVSENLAQLEYIINIGNVPKTIVTRSWYKGENETFASVTYTLKPSSKASCTDPCLRKTFKVDAGPNMYIDFVNEYLSWVDRYNDVAKMYENLATLQEVVDEIVAENNIPFSVKFVLGTGIEDITDDSITLGIKEGIVTTLAQLPLYNTVVKGPAENYKKLIAETLKACAKPIDVVKQNTTVMKNLGVFSRKSAVKLIRKNVTRNIAFTRVGTGYYDCDEYFTVIDKKLLTDAEAANLPEGTYVIDNNGASAAEKKAGKTKVAITYRVSPFNENGETKDIDIKSIPGIIDANK